MRIYETNAIQLRIKWPKHNSCHIADVAKIVLSSTFLWLMLYAKTLRKCFYYLSQALLFFSAAPYLNSFTFVSCATGLFRFAKLLIFLWAKNDSCLTTSLENTYAQDLNILWRKDAVQRQTLSNLNCTCIIILHTLVFNVYILLKLLLILPDYKNISNNCRKC